MKHTLCNGNRFSKMRPADRQMSPWNQRVYLLRFCKESIPSMMTAGLAKTYKTVTYLTAQSTVVFEKLLVTQPVRKFPTDYGT